MKKLDTFCQKKFIFGKITLVKNSLQLQTTLLQVLSTEKLIKKIVKFCRIPQGTETVIAIVKHKFHLEST